MRLLIVEDEQDLCRTMAQVLRSDGYEVDACGDAGQRWNWLQWSPMI